MGRHLANKTRRATVVLKDFGQIADGWRDDAETLRRRGAHAQAEAVESCVMDLEHAVREWELEELTLEQAAEESGYSYSAIQKKVRVGEIPNAGARGRPRIRRCDLPVLRQHPQRPRLETGEPDVAGEALHSRRLAS